MDTISLFLFFTVQPGIGTGDSNGQLGHSFHIRVVGLWGDVSNLGTVRFIAHQQHFSLLDVGDQELLKSTGQYVLCFPVAPITSIGQNDLVLESPLHPIVSASGFLPVPRNFNIPPVWLVPDDLLGPSCDNLGFHRGLRAAMVWRRRWLPPSQHQGRARSYYFF